MADADRLLRQEQYIRQARINGRQRQFQSIVAEQQRLATAHRNGDVLTPVQRHSPVLYFRYDDLTFESPEDLDFRDPKSTPFEMFECACRNSPLSTVQSIVTSERRSAAFLHHGLTVALSTGNVEIARYLLSAGAPIVRATPEEIFSAPSDQQIPLFELLTHHGWTPNSPGYHGNTLIARVATDLPLLSWFLAHGANPNLGEQLDYSDRFGGPDEHSCKALERAVSANNVEAVRMLLDAGAETRNGAPLHIAAGKCPPGVNYHDHFTPPSKDFDLSMIPVMELLVERGADVNQRDNDRHVVPRYAIETAVRAQAVERVRWLLEHGADPEVKKGPRNAVLSAMWQANEEMKKVVEEGVAARRWVKDDAAETDVAQ